MSRSGQLSIDLGSPRETRPGEIWLGGRIDHRALFDALQDEWLLPATGIAGRVFGVGAFSGSVDDNSNGRFISVGLRLNPSWLPSEELMVRRGGDWIRSQPTQVRPTDEAVACFGPVPTSAITTMVVANTEEKARLAGLARQVSNIALPEVVVESDLRAANDLQGIPLPADVVGSRIALPPMLDALRGALAMAVFSAPRIDPWMDVLVATLRASSDELGRLAAAVGAPWWSHPPWHGKEVRDESQSLETRLWSSACRALRLQRHEPADASSLIERIARDTICLAAEDKEALDKWIGDSNRLLRAETTVNVNGWRSECVRKAIQLVILRPEPARLVTWWDDIPALPPGLWWSAASLCGLLHGYRRLDIRFRGNPVQRRILLRYALRSAQGLEFARATPDGLAAAEISWRRQHGKMVLAHGAEVFGERPENSHSRWYAADLNNPALRSAAIQVARRLRWPCVRQSIQINDDELTASGMGKIEISPNTDVLAHTRIIVRGAARILLPRDIVVEEELDDDRFRWCIATEGVRDLSEPPRTEASAEWRLIAQDAEEDSAESPTSAPTLVPGLKYVRHFISETEEKEILATIDAAPWLKVLQRRVQHYGWRYDYRARQIDRSMHLGQLPGWAIQLAIRLREQGLLEQVADQVIVNEYVGRQGIARHVDCVPCFSDGIAMVSLLESWEMTFTEERGRRQKVGQVLESRSVAVMSGPARYDWSHEIPKRVKERNGLSRGRRISLTFRKVDMKGVKP